MTDAVNIHAAKTHLSRLIERVEGGEEIVIARAGRPVAMLVAFKPKRQPRRLGVLKGEAWIAPDFDTMSEEDLKDFHDGPIFPGLSEGGPKPELPDRKK
jgi:prevent-host-death family protein